eukprot:CAMPEP_0194137930 /NCGR_PEP_ID=MMETSP0152-20130528/7765_1 /TAXON_ID=1049557 /ORGANISM="Thalassiothrix antarctica, Strain L6-D1" /LENGTH=409 /DNA_ID=CAMNT_0038835151 /DNA_START=21 /DNA_END=1250 /DNA_ORIENTATION=+
MISSNNIKYKPVSLRSNLFDRLSKTCGNNNNNLKSSSTNSSSKTKKKKINNGATTNNNYKPLLLHSNLSNRLIKMCSNNNMKSSFTDRSSNSKKINNNGASLRKGGRQVKRKSIIFLEGEVHAPDVVEILAKKMTKYGNITSTNKRKNDKSTSLEKEVSSKIVMQEKEQQEKQHLLLLNQGNPTKELSKSSSYQNEAIYFNNTAVYHFEYGNYEKARTNFSDALKALRNGAVENENTSSSNNNEGQQQRPIRFKWSKYAPPHSEMLSDLPELSKSDNTNILRRALFIIDIKNSTTPSDNNNMDDVVAKQSRVIIYNLALSYLYSALKNKSMGLFKKSRQLFEKIINDGSILDDNQSNNGESNMILTNNSTDSSFNSVTKKASYYNVFSHMEYLIRTDGLKQHELILTLC